MPGDSSRRMHCRERAASRVKIAYLFKVHLQWWSVRRRCTVPHTGDGGAVESLSALETRRTWLAGVQNVSLEVWRNARLATFCIFQEWHDLDMYPACGNPGVCQTPRPKVEMVKSEGCTAKMTTARCSISFALTDARLYTA